MRTRRFVMQTSGALMVLVVASYLCGCGTSPPPRYEATLTQADIAAATPARRARRDTYGEPAARPGTWEPKRN